MRTTLDIPPRPVSADASPRPAIAQVASAAVRTRPGGAPLAPEPWDQPADGPRESSPSTDGLAPGDARPTEPGDPVFLDRSGRRGRKLRRLGWLLGSVCACYATVLGVSLADGRADAPWLLIPGRDEAPANHDATERSGERARKEPRALPGPPAGPLPRSGEAADQAGAGRRDHTTHHGHGARPADPSPRPKAPAPSPSATRHGPWPGAGGGPGTPIPAPSASTDPTPTPTPTATPTPTPTPTAVPDPSQTHPAPSRRRR